MSTRSVVKDLGLLEMSPDGSGSDKDMEDGNDGSQHSLRYNRIEELEDSPARTLAGNSGISQGGQAEEKP